MNGYAFQESFSPSVYSYSLEVPYQTEDIVVVAAANSADSSVSVKGAEGLQSWSEYSNGYGVGKYW